VTIDGFDYCSIAARATRYRVGVAGSGPPVLLLHGFPQNHYCWHRVAPALSARHTVVLCDLKGYGESVAAPGGRRGEGYSKREIAAELLQVMAQLGFDRFAVIGHDRGARVAYRLALDHTEAAARLCVLNIVPTVDQFEQMARQIALDYYPWLFLAQPAPFPERLIAGDAEYFLRHTLSAWTATENAIDEAAVERYLATFTPPVIAAICADYRASFHLDRPLDEADREAGRMITCPVLVHWGAEDIADPLPVWRRWCERVEGHALPGGHFIPEEAPEPLVRSLQSFLGA
jgi:haloacetate dehalogenase